jgi:hypothetical protein
MQGGEFSEDDLRRTLGRALRSLTLLAAAGAPITWWLAGWRDGWESVLLFLIGALIAAAGLWEWRRLMLAVLSRMELGGRGRPLAPVLVWFFLRLGLAAALLYVSLKWLNGSVYALCAGLGLAVLALLLEAMRLLRAWSA